MLSAKGADAPEAARDWAGEQALRDARGWRNSLSKKTTRILQRVLGREALTALALARAGDPAQAERLADSLDRECTLRIPHQPS